MAWGSVATSGLYAPMELAGMAVPLLAAAAVEGRGGTLARWRRSLEIIALAVFLLQVVFRAGVLPTTVNTLFVLCGVRLCLPRERPQRRQLLLMGFLVFLTTAVATAELDFLLWCLVWAAGGGLYLLHLNWVSTARGLEGPSAPMPLRAAVLWLAPTLALGAGFFVVIPRLHTSVRALPLGVQGPGGLRAGLSGVLDLSAAGPVHPGSDVALRIVPATPGPGFPEAYGLLRGVALESLEGQRWEVSPTTPRRFSVHWGGNERGGPFHAELFLSPNPLGLLPVPYGRVDLAPPEGEAIRPVAGGGFRIGFGVRQILPFALEVVPGAPESEPPPQGERLAFLLEPGRDTDCALQWSLREAPGDLPPAELASRLAAALRTYSYTLANPSGGKANPLKDFLERSRAGHCEYFASALAIMLRRREVPARVVNGFRLGTWIEEGRYYLVTQNEAHSWVEYYDPTLGCWRVEDPTPAAPPSTLGARFIPAALARFADVLAFQWDRKVVRFSDQDQAAGLAWLQAAGSALPPPRVLLAGLGVCALASLAWFYARPSRSLPGQPGAVRALRPLLRAVRDDAAPLPGETARAWINRLAFLNPVRSADLQALARETDAVTYGGKGGATLARLAEEEARAWTSFQSGKTGK